MSINLLIPSSVRWRRPYSERLSLCASEAEPWYKSAVRCAAMVVNSIKPVNAVYKTVRVFISSTFRDMQAGAGPSRSFRVSQAAHELPRCAAIHLLTWTFVGGDQRTRRAFGLSGNSGRAARASLQSRRTVRLCTPWQDPFYHRRRSSLRCPRPRPEGSRLRVLSIFAPIHTATVIHEENPSGRIP